MFSAGRKPAGALVQNKASFDVTYQPGVIEVVGYQGGKETGRTRLTTTNAPARLGISADRASIQAGCGDLAYVTIEILDQNGVLVRHGEPRLNVSVSGCAELLAIGSGDPISEEMYVGSHHKAYQGRLLAILRSKAEAGPATITVHADGLPEASLELQTISPA